MNLSKTSVYFNIEGHRRNLKAFNPLTELNLEKYADLIHPKFIDRFKELKPANGNGKSVLKHPREVRQALLSVPLRHEKIHQMKREEMGYRLGDKKDRRGEFEISVRDKRSGRDFGS